jgi:hypothetical protein
MKRIKSRGNSSVNIRKLPNVTSPVSLVLKPNEEIDFLGKIEKVGNHQWFLTPNGWVREDVVFITEPITKEKKVTLVRLHDNGNSIIGALIVVENGKMIFSCKTLELGYKDNQNMISSIPTGTYNVAMTLSPRFNRNMYLLDSVPNRSGVRIHSANFAHQLHGCIALGSNTKDINSDGNLDIVHSGQTMAEFESLMNNKPFKLEIKNSF